MINLEEYAKYSDIATSEALGIRYIVGLEQLSEDCVKFFVVVLLEVCSDCTNRVKGTPLFLCWIGHYILLCFA